MTSTIVWTGITLWLGMNAAFVAFRVYVTRPQKTVEPVPVLHRQFG